ncbi:MAG: hypothetical protein IEMM0008_1160 [bacterium]|nr:MAG: hypothetical protein IEMM0008_1160 [bacterium]
MSQDKEASAIKSILSNFFIWLIPGVLILTVSVILILILVLATPSVGGGSGHPFKKMPKGLASFLGIGHLLVGIGLISLLFFVSEIDTEGIITVVSVAIVSLLIGYWATSYDYKRLKKLFQEKRD